MAERRVKKDFTRKHKIYPIYYSFKGDCLDDCNKWICSTDSDGTKTDGDLEKY